MWYLLKLLLVGHVHEWEIREHDRIVNREGKTTGHIYTCRCGTCGKIKAFTVAP